MEAVFISIFNMSITASWLVLAVIILRLLLKKAPKKITVGMWALVGIRLVCPLSFESIFSLIPSAVTIPTAITDSLYPAIQSGIPTLDEAVNSYISEAIAPSLGFGINPIQVIIFIAYLIWIVGMVLMLLYSVISYFRIYIKVREATPLKNKIWICDRIDTPFIMGAIRPRIFLPSDISAQDAQFVIAHETAHLKRHDHWWKPLGFLLLTVYWFNPVLWVAYILLCRDIEIACDERVINNMGTQIKKPYSDALINCSVPRRMIAACPLAFGEVGIKGRIKSVLNYKKPAFWISLTAIVLCVAVAVGFATNPLSDKSIDEPLAAFIEREIDGMRLKKYEDHFYSLDWVPIETKRNGNITTVYMWVLYMDYIYDNGVVTPVKYDHHPMVITVWEDDGDYYRIERWVVRGKPYNVYDVKEHFPWYLRGKALDSERYIDEQTANCDRKAKEHFGVS